MIGIFLWYTENTISGDFHKVKTFTEKPTREIATTFIQSGNFLWNAGIFRWLAKVIVKAFDSSSQSLRLPAIKAYSGFIPSETAAFLIK